MRSATMFLGHRARGVRRLTMTGGSAIVALIGLAGGANLAHGATNTPEAPSVSTAACPANLQHTFPRLQDEAPQSLCQYTGKVLLVVNTASFCGYTGQYKPLEAMHAQLKDKGLVVLGFPSNDFEQERGSNAEIADFCENTYGVKFPMFGKSHVKGNEASPFYRDLAAQTHQAPQWNFNKYLIGRDGRVVAHYGSKVTPDDPRLMRDVEAQLAKPAPKAP